MCVTTATADFITRQMEQVTPDCINLLFLRSLQTDLKAAAQAKMLNDPFPVCGPATLYFREGYDLRLMKQNKYI